MKDERRVDQDGLWSPPDWQAFAPGEILAARRLYARVSQGDLAKLSGVSRNRISAVEAGRDAKLSSVLRIAAALGCDCVLRLKPRDGELTKVQHSPGRGKRSREWWARRGIDRDTLGGL